MSDRTAKARVTGLGAAGTGTHHWWTHRVTSVALIPLVAVAIGVTVPWLLRRFGSEPALATGPLLTTVTDMCGLFLALSFATVALSQLL